MAQKKTNGKDPAVLFYTQDFIVGTFTWNYEQKGKYITLLCLQHQKLNKLTLSEIQNIAGGDEIILEKFPLQEDGYYYNSRLAMEIENRKVKTESSRMNGMLGGRPKKTQEKPMGFTSVNLNETYNKPKQNPTGNANENEIENVNVSATEYAILSKLEDRLLDITTFKSAWNEVQEYGGIEKFFDALGYDESQRTNWNNHINNKLQILR